jgi:hypothetical protein
MDYLKDPSKKVDKQLKYKAIKYNLLEDELYYRAIDGVLLKCLGEEEAKTLMREIHEGVCGTHQSAFKMKWMIRNNNDYWLTILRLLQVLQRMPRVSEVWKHSKSSSIGNEPSNQAMAI